MNRWLTLTAGVVTTALLCTGLAFGQQKPAECNTKAPQKVEGQVVSVDQNAGKMTIRDKSLPTADRSQRWRVRSRTLGAGSASARTGAGVPVCR
jgi:hypothetical protein